MTLGLTLEKQIERFVLPWIIDDLPFDIMPIEIQGRMSVPEVRWSLALPLILAYLDSKGVQPEKRSDQHTYLEKLLIPESCGITREPATYDLNRIEALALPPFLFGIDAEASTGSGSLVSHNVSQDRRLSLSPLEGPHRLFGRGAPKSYDLAEALSEGLPSMGLGVGDVGRVIVELTSSALEDHFRRLGLVAFSAARKNPVFYFNSETVPSGKVKVRLPENSKTSYRNVWGKHKDIFWHLGMEFSVAVHESLIVTLNPHIVFTKDGLQEPLVPDAELNKKAQHSKRRKVARSWFNDKWRGFFYPFLAHVSNEENGIRIDIDDNGALLFSGALSKIVVPVTHAVVTDLQADDNVFDDEEELTLV